MLPAMDIDVSEVAALADAWAAAPEMALEEMLAAMTEAELLLERETREITPIGVSGGAGLRASIAAREPRVLADRVIGEVGTSLRHAVPVELGTRPHFPPVAALAEWAVVKLGVPREEADRIGFLIARKISRVGTEGAHMFARTFAAQEGQVRQIFAAVPTRVAQRLAGERA